LRKVGSGGVGLCSEQSKEQCLLVKEYQGYHSSCNVPALRLHEKEKKKRGRSRSVRRERGNQIREGNLGDMFLERK
jgi:hypothetical protein